MSEHGLVLDEALSCEYLQCEFCGHIEKLPLKDCRTPEQTTMVLYRQMARHLRNVHVGRKQASVSGP